METHYEKILAILACLVFASCATTNRLVTIAKFVAKTYPVGTYISTLHPIYDSVLKAR